MAELSRPDDVSTELGALKHFDIPPDISSEAQAAVKRLEREVEALKAVQHPGILKLIEADVAGRWFVTEYHPAGTLADHRSVNAGAKVHQQAGVKMHHSWPG
jgi:hypothetical protein